MSDNIKLIHGYYPYGSLTKMVQRAAKIAAAPSIVHIGPSSISGGGQGLFASRNFEPGELICEYSGVPIKWSWKEGTRGRKKYSWNIEADIVAVPHVKRPHIQYFILHSRTHSPEATMANSVLGGFAPNAVLTNLPMDSFWKSSKKGANKKMHRVFLRAVARIAQGSEILVDYGRRQYWEDGDVEQREEKPIYWPTYTARKELCERFLAEILAKYPSANDSFFPPCASLADAKMHGEQRLRDYLQHWHWSTGKPQASIALWPGRNPGTCVRATWSISTQEARLMQEGGLLMRTGLPIAEDPDYQLWLQADPVSCLTLIILKDDFPLRDGERCLWPEPQRIPLFAPLPVAEALEEQNREVVSVKGEDKSEEKDHIFVQHQILAADLNLQPIPKVEGQKAKPAAQPSADQLPPLEAAQALVSLTHEVATPAQNLPRPPAPVESKVPQVPVAPLAVNLGPVQAQVKGNPHPKGVPRKVQLKEPLVRGVPRIVVSAKRTRVKLEPRVKLEAIMDQASVPANKPHVAKKQKRVATAVATAKPVAKKPVQQPQEVLDLTQTELGSEQKNEPRIKLEDEVVTLGEKKQAPRKRQLPAILLTQAELDKVKVEEKTQEQKLAQNVPWRKKVLKRNRQELAEVVRENRKILKKTRVNAQSDEGEETELEEDAQRNKERDAKAKKKAAKRKEAEKEQKKAKQPRKEQKKKPRKEQKKKAKKEQENDEKPRRKASTAPKKKRRKARILPKVLRPLMVEMYEKIAEQEEKAGGAVIDVGSVEGYASAAGQMYMDEKKQRPETKFSDIFTDGFLKVALSWKKNTRRRRIFSAAIGKVMDVKYKGLLTRVTREVSVLDLDLDKWKLDEEED